jgi:hypothetical protein
LAPQPRARTSHFAAGSRELIDSLNHPLLEIQEAFIVHSFSFPNYLADLGAKA